MLKAIIFDCDGVIVNSEPHHLEAFQRILAEEGITLTSEAYYQTYLAMDDKGCFEAALTAHGRPVSNPILKRLITRKMALYRVLSQQSLYLYPGVVAFVEKAGKSYRLAIASGAFRGEIKFALSKGNMLSSFPVIVSAQDVKHGKPNPEAFQTALARLNAQTPHEQILPSECVVIEDSLHGVGAAKAAGMRCLAVTNSYARVQLSGRADRVVDSLTEIAPEDLEALCGHLP